MNADENKSSEEDPEELDELSGCKLKGAPTYSMDAEPLEALEATEDATLQLSIDTAETSDVSECVRLSADPLGRDAATIGAWQSTEDTAHDDTGSGSTVDGTTDRSERRRRLHNRV